MDDTRRQLKPHGLCTLSSADIVHSKSMYKTNGTGKPFWNEVNLKMLSGSLAWLLCGLYVFLGLVVGISILQGGLMEHNEMWLSSAA